MKKKVIIIGLSIFSFALFGQTSNEFKIGIVFGNLHMPEYPVPNGPYSCYDQTSYTSKSVTVEGVIYATSPFNVLAEDGFNSVYLFEPDIWEMSENQYRNTLELLRQNNLTTLANSYLWYVPTAANSSGINVYNNYLSGQTNHFTWNDPKAKNKARPNYSLLSSMCFKDAIYKDVIWGHQIAGEMNCRHDFNSSVNPLCYSPGPTYISSEIPPSNVSSAMGYFKNNLVASNQKIVLAMVNHGSSINDNTNDAEWTPELGVFQNTPNDWNPQEYINGPNKPDVILDASYYQYPINNWTTYPYSNIETGEGHYLGKYKSFDYYKKKGYNKIQSMISCERYWPNNNTDLIGHYNTTNVYNANWIWFQTYTSIIHGCQGIWLYTMDDYDSSISEQNKRTVLNDKGNTAQLNRFNRQYFSTNYNNYLRHLSRELKYLYNRGFLSTDPNTIIYTKTDQTDPNCIIPSAAYDPYNESYIATAMYDNNLHTPELIADLCSENYGLRYTIRNNGSTAIMIITNPLNLPVTVTLDFANITSPFIKNSTGVKILFENNVNPYNNSTYKTNRDGLINLSSNPNTTGKYYTLNYSNGKKVTLKFGPMDVHVLEFVTTPVTNYKNGWEKIWSNFGNNYLGTYMSGWGLFDDDKIMAGDFNGDGAEELFCIQGYNEVGGWATMLKYNNNDWQYGWSNNGNNLIGPIGSSWTIRRPDKFLVGDFDGDSKDELLCIQAYSSGNWATMFNFENNTWIASISNAGSNTISSWGITSLDKFIVGDFDGDSKDELFCIQASAQNNRATMIHFDNGSWSSGWSNGGDNTIDGWGIIPQDRFLAGDFDSDSKDELLCFQPTGWSTMLHFDNNDWQWGWSNYGSGYISMCWTIAATNKFLVGNIDNVDSKTEIMGIQMGSTATNTFSADFTSDWSCRTHANTSKPYINDWLVTETNSSRTNYLLIKAVANEPEYLIAYRKQNCNSKYLLSMYKSTPGSNKSTQKEGIFENESKGKIENSITVYPNPTTGSVNVILENSTKGIAKVFNQTGQLVLEQDFSSNNFLVDLSRQPKGIYIFVITSGNEVMREMVILH